MLAALPHPRLVALAWLGLCLAPWSAAPWSAGAWAQGESPSPTVEARLTFGETTEVSWVLVPVVVRGEDGFVRGLEPSAFRLFVDGAPTSIESVDAGVDVPYTLVFLQDLSGSMANAGKLEAGRWALRTILDDARAGDRLAVASFASGALDVDVPFTGDLDAVRDAASRWQAYGSTSLHDAIAWLPELQLAADSGRLAAVVVTDGVDNASVLEAESVREMVRRAEVPVYVLALRGSHLDPRLGSVDLPPPSAAAADDGSWTDRYASVLGRLATATTGRYFEIRTRAELADAVQAILDELRSQYTLSFLASGRGPAAHRRLRVEVERSDVDVAHRAGYVGTVPQRVGQSLE